MKNWLYDNRYGIGLFILAAIFLLPFLGMFPLTDPDEPVYGETAREMLAAADWLSPRIYNDFWYDKPPLFYWLEMISYRLFGISDFTSRLPSAVMGIATVCTVYRQGKAIFNKAVAFRAALILLTSLGFIYIAKAAVTDMTLVFTLTVAMLAFYRRRYAEAFAFCGLAVLAKGPVGYAFPALIMCCYIAVCRHWRLIRSMWLPQGIALAFLIGLPWYLAMTYVHGDAFVDTFIGYHNITRFTAPEHPGKNSLFFYIPILLGALLPWTGALAPAFRRAVREGGPDGDALRFCLIWAVFIFLFFSLSKTQLVTYIAPMFPPVALLLGWYSVSLEKADNRPRLWPATSFIVGAALLLCNLLPLHTGSHFYKEPILTVSILLAAAVILPGLLLWLRRRRLALYTTVLSMLLFTGLTFAAILPALAPYITSQPLAAALAAHYDGTSPVYIEKSLRPGLAFYSGVYGTEWKGCSALDPVSLRSKPDRVYILIPKDTYGKLTSAGSAIAQFPVLADLPAQLILLNHF
ncbi:ArnT family glycosyltransferase [Megasphaera vaginalis (ex Bordigoni et al. 2020)]|uniref:ArnT family glycosyltransferase n=1 Tax=Megasphaera vaginalis (ex Bordigoni et al. 2020) TaxID=2045301 RepID=UPI000C7DBBA4|nr:glycosyltransferase family 39 protein [Megasphaera vaginalis (ex Bordigoni et al. 2020)]